MKIEEERKILDEIGENSVLTKACRICRNKMVCGEACECCPIAGAIKSLEKEVKPMYKIKMLCFDPTYGLTPYEDEPAETNRFETAEAAYEHALELAEEEVEVLNDGCDENISFGIVEDEEKDCIRVLCYLLDGPEDTTGETEQVTTYWVEEAEAG